MKHFPKDFADQIKKMTLNELSLLASDCRENILAAVSKNGGHLSSNLGVVEATIALFKVFDFDQDKIIFDVGHQSYTYKMLTGRSLERLRQSDGVSGFPTIEESSYDHYGTGHSSTSISAACGFAYARDLLNKKHEVIAFVGDASLVNGMSFEGINLIGKNNHKVIIILNDNDMAISKPVGVVSDVLKTNGSIQLFKDLGYEIIGPVDGHDFNQLIESMYLAKKSLKSVVIHLKTKKGYGYKFAEEDEVGDWHGVPPFDIENGVFQDCDNSLTWSKLYADILHNEMKTNNKVISIVPATGYGSNLKTLFSDFPDRTIDVGIAEEHAVTMAASLALEKFRPVISIYSTFLQRTYDQILHELARQNCGVTFLVDRAGLVGGDGETHQGIYDESFLLSLPNTVVAMADCKENAVKMFNESLKINQPFFIRYPKETLKDDDVLSTELGEIGEWNFEVEKQTSKVIISFGPAIKKLKKEIIKNNLNIDLVNAFYQKPIDISLLRKLSKQYSEIVIYNPYSTSEGFSKAVIFELNNLSFKGMITDKSLPTAFIKQGKTEEILSSLHLNVSDILD